ncbi:MAG: YfcC family protein [Firmicutes bacterium]|nr:YfcC family protein [Bacillota bacterium]
MENNNGSSLQISKKSFFSSVAILLMLMIGAGILTNVIPSGAFEKVLIDGKEAIVPGTFEFTGEGGYAVWRWFTAPVEVLWSPDAVTVIMIIAFICIIGGTFTVLDKSGMLQYIMNSLVKRFEKSKYMLMAILTLFFMLFGSVFGIFEELVALVPIVIILSYALGWDSLTGLGMSALAAGFGFSSATLNPFTLGVAQELAGLPAFSGIGFRIFVFAVCYGILYGFLYRYAKKIEKMPQKSSIYEDDLGQKEKYANITAIEALPNEQYLGKTVKIFGTSLVLVIAYIVAGFFVPALSAVSLPVMALIFLVGGILAANASKYGGNIFKDFVAGIGGIAPSGLLILMAMSVKLIITNGGIMDTILYYASEKVSQMGPHAAIIMIFLLVLGLNFFVSSGSAKAFLLIPIIAPLAELVGLNSQIAVQAFCFGDGFTNMLYPTNAVLMITLGLTVVSYPKWFKWTIGLQLFMLLVNMALLLLAVVIGYGA